MLVRTTIALRHNVAPSTVTRSNDAEDPDARQTGQAENLNQEAFAQEIYLKRSVLSDLECRKTSMGLDYLTRLQLRLGVPNGVILCISHVAAMARDASTKSGAERDLEIAKLALMADYLSNLAKRIRQKPSKRRPPLSSYPGIDATQNATWAVLLADLIAATQHGHDPSAETVFADATELARLFKP